MKKINLFSLLSVLSLILLATSCGGGGDDNGTPTKDTTPPVIASDFTPAEGAEFIIGSSTIVVTANVSDNEALGSYKIDIHNNFDDHGSHTKAFEASTNTRSIEYAAFAAVKTGKLSGKTATIKESIEVKDFNADGKRNKDGKYHLVLTVIDAAGNETVSFRNIVLKD